MASGSTTNYSLPYPLSTDSVNVHGDMQDLAEALDTTLNLKANLASANAFTSGGHTITNSADVIALRLKGNSTQTNSIFSITNSADVVLFSVSNTGVISSATWNGEVISGQYGGTGVANTGKTITVSGNTTIGSSTHTVSFVTTGNTSVTLPTSGTLVNSSVTTLSSLVSIGTITTGTWNATAIAANYGGTGQTSYAIGDILYASTTSALSKLAGVATGNALISGGVSTAPSWGKIGLTTHISGTLGTGNGGTGLTSFTSGGAVYATSTSVLTTGTLPAASGGTGQASYTVGDILYASSTTALSKLAGVATGNALISGGVGTAPSWGKIGLTTHVSGTLPVGNGGTGLTTFTTGDIVYASAANTLASLAGVSTGNVLLSGGVGTAPSYGKVGLTTHVSGTLAVGNGGTGATTFTSNGVLLGNTTSAISATVAGSANQVLRVPGAGGAPAFGSIDISQSAAVTGTLAVGNGGTGLTTYTIGDIIYASAATTLTRLAGVATGNALISGGVGAAPSYGKIGLTTHISGTLAVGNGGTGLTTFTTGDIVYASAANTLASLAGVATGNVLISGGVGAAPSYDKVGLTTHVSGTLPVANGGTNITTYATGDILYASAANTLSKLAAGTNGHVLTLSGGVPTWSAAAAGYTAPTLGTTTIASGTTYTNVNGLTINSTTIPSSKTLVVTTDKLSVLAATTSAELAGVISDETGSGSLVFGTSPTISTPTLTLSSTTSTASGRIAFDATNDKIVVGDGTNAVEFASSTPLTNAQTGATYTLVLTDKDKVVERNNASANTLTIPLNSSVAFPVGSQIVIIQTGAGQTTIDVAVGVTLNCSPQGTANTAKIRGQWSSTTLIKRATDTWIAIGDLVA